MPTGTNNDILIYITDPVEGNLVEPAVGSYVQFVSLSKVDSSGNYINIHNTISSNPIVFTLTKGIYKIDLTNPIFTTNSGFRFVGVIDCTSTCSPRYQAFDYRPEDQDAVTASVVTSVNSNVVAVSSKVDSISTAVSNITSVKYYIQAKKVSTGETVSWVSTNQNSQKPSDTYPDTLTDFVIKGSFI
jgi:hypothetical protein